MHNATISVLAVHSGFILIILHILPLFTYIAVQSLTADDRVTYNIGRPEVECPESAVVAQMPHSPLLEESELRDHSCPRKSLSLLRPKDLYMLLAASDLGPYTG